MDEQTARFERLYQRGSEQLISDSSLRDALEDDQAQQLLAWAMAQVRDSAESAQTLPPAEAEAAVEARVQQVRRAMRQVNEIVERGAGGGEAMYAPVLRFVEALHALDLHTTQLDDLLILEKLALKEGDLSPRRIFSTLHQILTAERE